VEVSSQLHDQAVPPPSRLRATRSYYIVGWVGFAAILYALEKRIIIFPAGNKSITKLCSLITRLTEL